MEDIPKLQAQNIRAALEDLADEECTKEKIESCFERIRDGITSFQALSYSEQRNLAEQIVSIEKALAEVINGLRILAHARTEFIRELERHLNRADCPNLGTLADTFSGLESQLVRAQSGWLTQFELSLLSPHEKKLLVHRRYERLFPEGRKVGRVPDTRRTIYVAVLADCYCELRKEFPGISCNESGGLGGPFGRLIKAAWPHARQPSLSSLRRDLDNIKENWGLIEHPHLP
jgi:hypothetical protein